MSSNSPYFHSIDGTPHDHESWIELNAALAEGASVGHLVPKDKMHEVMNPDSEHEGGGEG